MNVIVPYFLTGMAVTALGCLDGVTRSNPVWNAVRAEHRKNPAVAWIAVTLAVALCSCFWPFVLWSITKGRAR